ncbi:MAG: tetratricopeptide repeat protein [Heliobacteriaceae bacterium]|jgi:tetratricopeptide (TPR) repeat protein|nr:tetratricopeptide repeat protein [Heliobacteriaceae bacterium]
MQNVIASDHRERGNPAKIVLFLDCFVALLLAMTFCGAAFAAEYVPDTDARLEYNQGVDFYKLGQYDRAMAAFRTAISRDPNFIDAYFNLGSILEYLQQNDAALAVFKQIILRKPDDYESLYKAASLSAKLGQPDKAKEYLALIPPSSAVYSKAQELAAGQLLTDMQTIKKEQISAAAKEEGFDRSNAVYNDILSPTGITSDMLGNLYVASFSDNTIYKITSDGKRVIFAKDPKISGPIGMVSDMNGNIYVANYNSNSVLKISPSGTISMLVSNLQKPYGLHINGSLLFISCQGSNSVLRYKL